MIDFGLVTAVLEASRSIGVSRGARSSPGMAGGAGELRDRVADMRLRETWVLVMRRGLVVVVAVDASETEGGDG